MRILRSFGALWEKVQAMFYRYLGRNYQCDCGHTIKRKTVLTIHGKGGVFTAPNKKPEYCGQCFANAAIACAWCGETIVPGQAITLYTPKNPSYTIPDNAVVYGKEPLQLVGCLRWNCAESGADRTGFWVMPGKVQRVLSPIEELIARGGDDPIIFNDLGSIQNAIPVSDN